MTREKMVNIRTRCKKRVRRMEKAKRIFNLFHLKKLANIANKEIAAEKQQFKKLFRYYWTKDHKMDVDFSVRLMNDDLPYGI